MRLRRINWVSIAIFIAILSVIPAVLQAETEEAWNFLRDFTLVRGAVRPVKQGYVGAVMHNSAMDQFALVIYTGACIGQGCVVDRRVAYFVVDTKGHLLKSHVEPGASLDRMIGGFQIS